MMKRQAVRESLSAGSTDGYEHRTVFAIASYVASPYQQHRNKSCHTNKDQTLTETFFILKEDPRPTVGQAAKFQCERFKDV
jgi:hypothetical protein